MKNLNVEIVNTAEKLNLLEKKWNELYAESKNPSVFSSFTFVSIAWKHFATPKDTLFILLLKQDCDIVAIAPLRIDKQNVLGLPILRVIKFIVEWGEGDKPSIISKYPLDLIWERIYTFLHEEYKAWDTIFLMEQEKSILNITQKLFNTSRYQVSISAKLKSFYVQLKGSWEDYFSSLLSKRRQELRKVKKKLKNDFKENSVTSYHSKKDVLSALDRYITVEQSGWKRKKEFSVGGNKRLDSFYKDLILKFSQDNSVSIHILSIGKKDIASLICYRAGNIVYFSHITYDTKYAKYSPGIVIIIETIKSLFESGRNLCDFLCLQISDEKRNYKRRWATDDVEVFNILIKKPNLRTFVYSINTSIKQTRKTVFSGNDEG